MSDTSIPSAMRPRSDPPDPALARLPAGGFTLHPFEAWSASPVGPAFCAAAAFTALSLAGRAAFEGSFEARYV